MWERKRWSRSKKRRRRRDNEWKLRRGLMEKIWRREGQRRES